MSNNASETTFRNVHDRLPVVRCTDVILAALQAAFAQQNLTGTDNPYWFNRDDPKGSKVWICAPDNRVESERNGARMQITVRRGDLVPAEAHLHNYAGKQDGKERYTDLLSAPIYVVCEAGSRVSSETLANICSNVLKMFRRQLMDEFNVTNLKFRGVGPAQLIRDAAGGTWATTLSLMVELQEMITMQDLGNSLNETNFSLSVQEALDRTQTYNVAQIVVDSNDEFPPVAPLPGFPDPIPDPVVLPLGGGGVPPTVFLAPMITSSLTSTVERDSVFSYQITASNTPTSFNATGLPPGVHVDRVTGLLSGTPTVAGIFGIVLTATNRGGYDQEVLTLTVSNPIVVAPPVTPVITSPLTASGTESVYFSYQIAAANTPTSFNATGLPPGLSINTTSGVISGTPSVVDVTVVSISATNAAGTDTEDLTITIDAAVLNPPSITSALVDSVTETLAYSYTITATNDPVSFDATDLPSGLTFDGIDTITGAPDVPGVYNITISATNGDGTGSDTLELTVLAAVAPVWTFDDTPITVFEGAYVSISLTLDANPITPSVNMTGAPSGLSVNFSGAYSANGNVSGPGFYTVSFEATNVAGSDTRTIDITVQALALSVAGSPGGTFDGTYNVAEAGFYYYDFDTDAVAFDAFNAAPFGSVSVWRNNVDSDLAIFYFSTYDSWILADTSTYAGLPPVALVVNASNIGSTVPPDYSWTSANNDVTVSHVPA